MKDKLGDTPWEDSPKNPQNSPQQTIVVESPETTMRNKYESLAVYGATIPTEEAYGDIILLCTVIEALRKG